MKTDDKNIIEMISGYLDNALSPEETGCLLERIRNDQAAADLMCELSIQHVQLRRIFKEAGATAVERNLRAVSVFSHLIPVRRSLALAACLAVILATGFWLGRFIHEHYLLPSASIVLRQAGQESAATECVRTVAAGALIVAPAGNIQILRFKDGTTFEFGEGSKAQIADLGSTKSGKIVKLMTGAVIADVARQPADFPLRVITPHLEVIVAGTRLTCKVEGDHTHVRMHQGWAHVIHFLRGEKLKLEAGQHVTVGERFHFRVRSIHEGEH